MSRLKKRVKTARTPSSRLKDLSKNQLSQLLTYEPRTKTEEKYKDIWLFSYYTFGVNLTDIAHLRSTDIRDNRWYYARSKTGIGLRQGKPLLPEALAIIKKYDSEGTYIFDILKDDYNSTPLRAANRIHCYARYITDAMKNIAKTLDFPTYFTYYSARYTAATLALNAGADRNTVSHLLDHSNFSTIDHYVGQADVEGVAKAMEVLRI